MFIVGVGNIKYVLFVTFAVVSEELYMIGQYVLF